MRTTISTDGLEELMSNFEEIATEGLNITKQALYEAANVTANAIKASIDSIPVDTPRYLTDGDTLNVITQGDLDDLRTHMGISKMQVNGVDVIIGFNGYGSHSTKSYPQGYPMQMIANSIESGSSVRQKYPFMRTAVNSTKESAKMAANSKITQLVEEILNK